MSSSWSENSKRNLLPQSKSSRFVQALTEWVYTGECFDLEEAIEDCQLCEHPEIRYQFEIENQLTGNKLLVGSECIKKFEIRAITETGILDNEGSRKKVDKDRAKLIKDAKFKRVIHTLLELLQKDPNFEIDTFIKYYKDRKAFTPKQLA